MISCILPKRIIAASCFATVQQLESRNGVSNLVLFRSEYTRYHHATIFTAGRKHTSRSGSKTNSTYRSNVSDVFRHLERFRAVRRHRAHAETVKSSGLKASEDDGAIRPVTEHIHRRDGTVQTPRLKRLCQGFCFWSIEIRNLPQVNALVPSTSGEKPLLGIHPSACEDHSRMCILSPRDNLSGMHIPHNPRAIPRHGQQEVPSGCQQPRSFP
jgi:hypothetical protein